MLQAVTRAGIIKMAIKTPHVPYPPNTFTKKADNE